MSGHAHSASLSISPLAAVLGLSNSDSPSSPSTKPTETEKNEFDFGVSSSTIADSPSAKLYLSQLPSKSLKNLLDEPRTLKARAESLQNDLTSLTYRSAPVLLSAYTAQTNAVNSVGQLDSNLDQFLESLSSLEHLSKDFSSNVCPPLESQRTKLIQAHNHVDTAHEILHLPHLIATCIRADLWSEALELAEKVPPFGTLPLQVDSQINLLRAKIWDTLARPDLKLPAASRAASTLRRLRKTSHQQQQQRQEQTQTQQVSIQESQYDEEELKWAILILRWKAFDPKDAQEHGIRHYVDRWRERVSDAVSIVTTLFPGSTTSSSSSSPSSSQQKSLSQQQSALHAFLSHAVNDLVETVEQHLITDVSSVSGLVALLTQIGYASKAFARFGLDFSPLVIPLFIDRTAQIVLQIWGQGIEAFCNSLNNLGYSQHLNPSQPELDHDHQKQQETNSDPASNLFSFENYQHFYTQQTTSSKIQHHHRSSSSGSRVTSSPMLNSTSTTSSSSSSSTSTPTTTTTPAPAPPTRHSHVARLINSQIEGLNQLRLLPSHQLFRKLELEQRKMLIKVESIVKSIEAKDSNAKWCNEMIDGITWCRYAFYTLYDINPSSTTVPEIETETETEKEKEMDSSRSAADTKLEKVDEQEADS